MVNLNSADLPFSVTPALAELRLHMGHGINKDMEFDEYKQQALKQYLRKLDNGLHTVMKNTFMYMTVMTRLMYMMRQAFLIADIV